MQYLHSTDSELSTDPSLKEFLQGVRALPWAAILRLGVKGISRVPTWARVAGVVGIATVYYGYRRLRTRDVDLGTGAPLEFVD